MKTHRRLHRSWVSLLIALALTLPLFSCQSRKPVPQAATGPGGESQSPAIVEGLPAQPAGPANDTKESLAPGYDLALPSAALDNLAGYHQEFYATVVGKAGGKDYASAQSVLRDVSAPDESAEVRSSLAGSPDVYLFAARLGDYRYSQGAEGAPCRAAPAAAGDPDLNPALRLPRVFAMQEAGRETVDGIPAVYYTFDERSVPHLAGEGDEARGEVWLAEDTRAVLKYELTVETTSPEFSGTRKWSYALSKLGQGIPIALPAPCQPVLADIPTLDGAADLLLRPGFQTYTAPAGRAAAVQFFHDRLTAGGWDALPGSAPDQADLSGGVTVLSYGQAFGEGGRLLVIQLLESGGALRVIAQSALTAAPPLAAASGPAPSPDEEATDEPEAPAGPNFALPPDLPDYPGMHLISRDVDFLMFDTPDPTATVIDFYAAYLEAAGWTLMSEEELAVSYIQQIWEKDALLLDMAVFPMEGVTQGIIVVMRN